MTDHNSPPSLVVLTERARSLLQQFNDVRARTVQLAAPLTEEDQCVQSMPDASPTKWHLAHTTWFFETVVLQPFMSSYLPFDPHFAFLFNSYYEALGPRHPRPQRGLLTRPSLTDIHAYRAHINGAIATLLQTVPEQGSSEMENQLNMLELGIHHEQQHQELLLTDILHLFSCNPLLPAYGSLPLTGRNRAQIVTPKWLQLPGGTVTVGNKGAGMHPDSTSRFSFDNESPRHQRLLEPYQLACNLVSCGDFLEFVEDGGYNHPRWWLSDGWAAVQSQGWTAPAYWLQPGDSRRPSDNWQIFGLRGVHPIDLAQPVAHLSFFEAAAYAEWAGARLPTEFEWEAAINEADFADIFGAVWQWTRSSYEPYPGFKPRSGAVREYNGKFMVGQQVLRGSSVATPPGHSRETYRNFFHPAARWQFSGLRLAKDME